MARNHISLIVQKQNRFLITDRPTEENIDEYLKVGSWSHHRDGHSLSCDRHSLSCGLGTAAEQRHAVGARLRTVILHRQAQGSRHHCPCTLQQNC